MTASKGVIDPKEKDKSDDMFVGWASAPRVDRRFLMGALPIAFLATTATSWAIAKKLDDPGAGAWLTSDLYDISGALIAEPYPMIRVPDPAAPGGARTVLVVAQGKCTSALKLSDYAARPVTASGVLIQRKDRQMLEVPPLAEDWLTLSEGALDASVATPTVVSHGRATLAGTIMDSKCFFGVMRPGRGKTHKACASLCIRGGIPPSFWARTRDGKEAVMLMTDADGGPMPMDILPFVADPVEAEGEIVQVGDLLQFRADTTAYRRI